MKAEGSASMYQTTSLIDAAVLALKGQSYRIKNGTDALVFCFDEIGEAEASQILTSADASVCRGFHLTVRALRRRMDALTGRASR